MNPVIINHASLTISAVRKEQYPEGDLPEVAFAGKSNVGKSSLINAMLGRKALARSSQYPGKTRTINFYDVEHKLYFVDLPGYGYARVSRSESEKWGAMIESYLKGRENLRLILLLLDIRHEPNENDKMMYDWCVHFGLPCVAVATKSDKVKRSQVQKHISVIRKTLGLDAPPLTFSSESKDGRDNLWALIMDSCGINML